MSAWLTEQGFHLGWTVIALAAACLAVALLIVARLRWAQMRPLRACLVLSVCAHVLLLGVFYFSRLFDMPFIPGGDQAMIVQVTLDDSAFGEEALEEDVVAAPAEDAEVVAEEIGAVNDPAPQADDPIDPPESFPVEPEAEPELDEITPTESQDQRSEDDRARVVPEVPPAMLTPAMLTPAMLPPGELPPEALNIPDANSVLADNFSDKRAADDLPSADMREGEAIIESDETQSPDANDLRPWQAVTQWKPAPRYRDRTAKPTGEELELRGGNPRTEAAVAAGLNWLAMNQDDDGKWSAAAHGGGQGGWIDGQHRGSTGLQADTGITGLAVLCFLGAGETHQRGSYQSQVQRALDYLASQQNNRGSLAGKSSIYAQMYCHGMATLAMCEALAMTGDDDLLVPAQRAIDYTVASQHPSSGGWRYRPGDRGDTSQFGWQLMALTAAKEAQLAVPEQMDGLLRKFLRSVQCGPAGGLASYRPGHGVSRSMTAEAMACRLLLGWQTPAQNEEAAALLMAEPPGRGRRNFYYWYYGTLALSQCTDANLDDDWRRWNRALQKTLLGCQQRHGREAGSWAPNTVWGNVGGRVYTTSLAVLCLESYYRYAPTSPRRQLVRQGEGVWSRR